MGKPTMKTHISLPNLSFSYNIIAINTIDYEEFINSDEPEEIILAILADFKNVDKKVIIQKILNNLNEKTKNKKSRKKLNKYIFQLEILGHLRSLQTEIIYQIKNMSLEYDVRQDLRYIQGAEEATAVAAKAAAEATAKAAAEATAKAAKTISNLFSKGILTAEEIAEIVEMPLAFVLAVQNKQ